MLVQLMVHLCLPRLLVRLMVHWSMKLQQAFGLRSSGFQPKDSTHSSDDTQSSRCGSMWQVVVQCLRLMPIAASQLLTRHAKYHGPLPDKVCVTGEEEPSIVAPLKSQLSKAAFTARVGYYCSGAFRSGAMCACLRRH